MEYLASLLQVIAFNMQADDEYLLNMAKLLRMYKQEWKTEE